MGEGRNREMTQPQVLLLHKTSLTVRKNPTPKTKTIPGYHQEAEPENILPPSLPQEGLSACSGGRRTLLLPPTLSIRPTLSLGIPKAQVTLPGQSQLQQADTPLAQYWGTPRLP